MKYRLQIALVVLVLMAVGLLVQRIWIAGDGNKTAKAAVPTGPTKLSHNGQWQSAPEFLSNATILGNDTPASPEIRYVAAKDGLLLLAASWTYDGDINADESWTPQCQTLIQLRHDGWVPIGKMDYLDGDRHYIFRRNVRAGEKIRVQTRLKTPGFLVVVPDADLDRVMAVEPLVAEDRRTLLEIGLTKPPDEQTAAAVSGAVTLHSPEPDQRFGKYSRLGLLLREIVRQGVALAAREELGLSTCDYSLREVSPGRGKSKEPPLDVIAISQPLNEILFGVFRRQNDRWEALCDDHIRFPADNLYERVTAAIESQSRNEFVAALKRAGFEGVSLVATRDNAPIPPEAAEFADELTIPAQYGVVRCLHSEIRKNGQSPELLGALARSYALLGVLTDHLWSPSPKVFQARSLLYAECAANRWPQSAVALYSRAYARALIGLHRTALEDVSAAANIKESGVSESPPWAAAIEAYCRFDAEALEAAAKVPAQRSFVRLLQLLAAESGYSERDVIAASRALLEEAPGCLRTIDGGTDVKQLGFHRYIVALGSQSAERNLLSQVRKVPRLPESAVKIIDDYQSASRGGMLASLLGAKPRDEMATRLKVISALREASAAENGPSGLPWADLAQLLEEIGFLDAWRRVNVAAVWLGIPADNELDATAAQVEHHPYAKFLETYRSNSLRAQEALEEFVETLDLGHLSFVEDPMVQRLRQKNPQWAETHFPFGLYWSDSVVSELAAKARSSTDARRTAVRLRDISPYMPFSVMMGLNYDLDGLRSRKPELEKKYSGNASVMAMLGQCYFNEQKTDDAIRCLQVAVKLDPSQQNYMALSEAYRLKGDEADWLSTLEAYLKTEDYGLGHAQIQVKIADHFIGKGDWARARPYADAAAESWAAWALLKAGQCAEVMQDWQAAEHWYAGLAQRYPENAWAWYEFCRRTGRGDQQRALQFALPFVRRMEFGTADEQFRAGVVHALANRSRDAAAVFDSVYRLQPTPTIGLHALLEFDESGDIQSRDRILDAIHQRRTEDLVGSQSGVAQLAELIYNSKPKEALPAVAPDKLEEIVATAAEGERAVLLYLIGRYLDRTGQNTDGVMYLKRCLRERYADPCDCTRSLAGAALVDRGVAPPNYLEERSKDASRDSEPAGT